MANPCGKFLSAPILACFCLGACVAIAQARSWASEEGQDPSSFEAGLRPKPEKNLRLAIRTLASRTKKARHDAAGYLGWAPHQSAIEPILRAAQETDDGDLRRTLMFDLSVILLAEGAIDRSDQTAGAARLHLKNVFRDLAANGHLLVTGSNVGARRLLLQKTVLVFPGRVPESFEENLRVSLSKRTQQFMRWVEFRDEADKGSVIGTSDVDVVSANSVEAFREWIGEHRGLALLFHEFRSASGLTRVGLSAILQGVPRPPSLGPSWYFCGLSWIGIYRETDDGWETVSYEDNTGKVIGYNYSNVYPHGETNYASYGLNDPLTFTHLNLMMEKLAILDLHTKLDTRQAFMNDILSLDSDDLPLLRPYLESESELVRVRATLLMSRLLEEPLSLSRHFELISEEYPQWVRLQAYHQLNAYLLPRFSHESRSPNPEERTALTRETVLGEGVKLLSGAQDVKIWKDLALVTGRFSSGYVGNSGGSVLFELRENGWQLVCVLQSWMD